MHPLDQVSLLSRSFEAVVNVNPPDDQDAIIRELDLAIHLPDQLAV